MNNKVDSEYKDIVVELLEDIESNLKPMRVKQGQTFKVIGSIFHSNRPLRIKSRNKDYNKINHTMVNCDPERDCINSDLLLHYLYFKSNRNVLCKYFQGSNYFMDESQTNNFDLFNYNFCPYCSIEVWLTIGGTLRDDF